MLDRWESMRLGGIAKELGVSLPEPIPFWFDENVRFLSSVTAGGTAGGQWERPPAADPLTELERLSASMVGRLRTMYHVRLVTIAIVGLTLLVVLAWSILLVTRNERLHASIFGATGVGGLILCWRWEPLEKLRALHRELDEADVLCTAVRLRLESVAQVQDHSERAREQWKAATEFLQARDK